MKKGTRMRLANFVFYQSLWLSAVMLGNAYIIIPCSLILLHLLIVDDRPTELALVMTTTFIGTAVDSFLASAGYFEYRITPELLPIPLWHVAIWAGFATTLRHSLAFIVGIPSAMSLAALVFAPLVYWTAARLEAVAFPLGLTPTLIVIGLTWYALVPLFCWATAKANAAYTPSSSPYQDMSHETT